MAAAIYFASSRPLTFTLRVEKARTRPMTCSNILYPYRMPRKMFLVWELQTYVKYSVMIPSSWEEEVIEEKIMNINVL